MDYLNPLGDNFILKKLWVFLNDIISFLNPSSDNFFGKKIIELIGDLLKFLFIPSDDFFSSNFDKIKINLSNRLSYQSYINLLEQTKNLVADEQIFIDFNNYNVGTNNISVSKFIDFSIFNKYKSIYYAFIRGTTFIFMVIFVINHFYKMIRGTNLINFSGKGGDDK